jgi:hypothetical protein
MCASKQATSGRQFPGGSGLGPAIGLALLLEVCSWTGSTLVSDAKALGFYPTRLETRTKESNVCASRWDSSR